jgi:hypothetical protein
MKIFLVAILNISCFIAFSQVPRQVIIEHFTNTYCSICGNTNPSLNNNLANQPNILRISYHPSSPYANCTLNQHNVAGNDARTNQYGIYGATPRIVIQGEVQSPGGSNFSNPSLFSNYEGELSPLSIEIITDTSDLDSIAVVINITVEDDLDITHQFPILYAGLAEDTIQFNAPNGENNHYYVFRKELYGTMGTGISLNDIIGDQFSIEFKVVRNPQWNIDRIFAFATIQDASTNEILQSGASNFTPDYSLDIKQRMNDNYHFSIYNDNLEIRFDNATLFDQVVVFDLQGKIVISENVNSEIKNLNISNLEHSLYIVQLINQTIPTSTSFKMVK